MFEDLVELQGDGFWYMATPYSLYNEGLDQAYRDACVAAGEMIACGVNLFSPIAHSHPISVFGDLTQTDHTLWMRVDYPMMRAAMGLIIVEMPGWKDSIGVQEEIGFFEKQEKPVKSVKWPL